MEKIKIGMTNISFKDDDVFFQIKKINENNHKIDYHILKVFDFVPKLIENNEKTISWEFIYGKQLEINESNLKKIALMLSQIHNSKLLFPHFNHIKRVNIYQQQIKEKGIIIPIIDKYFKIINSILSKSKRDTPLHNDLRPSNIIDQNGKMFLVDWEYASMGDKHFDLAYFIESAELNSEQEAIFLNAYGEYNQQDLIEQKILVNYLIILWLFVQPIKYFDEDVFIKKIDYLLEYLK